MESDMDCPIPIKYIDVWRHTTTDCEQQDEQDIFDVWVGDKSDSVELSEPWTGKVKFFLLELQPRRGYMWSCGREARIQSNTNHFYIFFNL